MKPPVKQHNEAVTVLEILILCSALVVMGWFLSALANGYLAPSAGEESGILPAIAEGTGKTLRVAGSVTVFTAKNNNPSDVGARYPVQYSTRMGSLEANVALLIGDSGGVDFDRVVIVWISNGTAEKIPRKDTRPLVCPGWTIAGKYNVIPLKSANSNNILEPGEQFLIFICPAVPLPAYQSFTVKVEDTGGIQSPFLGGTAPVMTSPVCLLL